VPAIPEGESTLTQARIAIATALRAAARKLAPEELHPVPVPIGELDKLFASLQRLNFAPRHIVDVGANRGGWSRTALRYFPDAHYTLVEPQPGMLAQLQDLLSANPRIRLHSVGAGPVAGVLPFTIHQRDDSCTFSLSAEEAYGQGLTQIRVPVATLDAMLRESTFPPPDMVKIDAEGFDLEVLKGATSAIESCEVLLVEAGVMNRKFANDLRSVVNRLADVGFRPFDVTDLNRTQRHGSLWLVEMAFTRIGGYLEGQITSYD